MAYWSSSCLCFLERAFRKSYIVLFKSKYSPSVTIQSQTVKYMHSDKLVFQLSDNQFNSKTCFNTAVRLSLHHWKQLLNKLFPLTVLVELWMCLLAVLEHPFAHTQQLVFGTLLDPQLKIYQTVRRSMLPLNVYMFMNVWQCAKSVWPGNSHICHSLHLTVDKP